MSGGQPNAESLNLKHRDSSIWEKFLAPIVLSMIAITAIIALVKSLNWPFVHDAPLMHYIVFLMGHGFSPYRDIFDMNMPGTYMTHWLVFHGLGGSALAWRFFDLLLTAATFAAAVYIARPYNRLAGWIIGGILVVEHLSVGAIDLGQRDYIMAVLLLAAYAFLFSSVRNLRARRMFYSSILFAWAAGIKPTAVPLAILMLVLGIYVVSRRGERIGMYVLSSAAGCVLVAAILLAFLVREHSVAAFIQIALKLDPYHESIGNVSWRNLLLNLHQVNWALTIVFGLLLLRICKCWNNWEQWALLLGVFFGAASYVAQRKGWHYHTYPEAYFIYTWIVILCSIAIRSGSRARYAAAAYLIYIAVLVAPVLLRKEFHSRYSMTNLDSMRADLRTLGGQSLNRNVQCFDWGAGCIDALYHERIVQATGAIYDFYLFPTRPNPVTRPYQDEFFHALSKHPPKVLIVTKASWPPGLGYQKIQNWPVFAKFLKHNYHLDTSSSLMANSQPNASYKIFLRNTL